MKTVVALILFLASFGACVTLIGGWIGGDE